MLVLPTASHRCYSPPTARHRHIDGLTQEALTWNQTLVGWAGAGDRREARGQVEPGPDGLAAGVAAASVCGQKA